MKRFHAVPAAVCLCCTIAVPAILAAPQPAQAGTLHQGWNYAIDSQEDSLGIRQVGNTVYELNALALKQTADKIHVAINAKMPFQGTYDAGAIDRHVGYSDLLFNFTGQNLATANRSGSLLGIRFTPHNDSNAPQLGVYSGVTATNKAAENDNPQGSLQGYINAVHKYGKTTNIGDLAATDSYFDQGTHIPSLIASGTWLGGIETITDFASLGLDFGHFKTAGDYTYGFSFDRSLLPDGDFIAHLSLDCNNDHVALIGTLDTQPVPEPATALALAGVAALGLARRRQDQAS